MVENVPDLYSLLEDCRALEKYAESGSSSPIGYGEFMERFDPRWQEAIDFIHMRISFKAAANILDPYRRLGILLRHSEEEYVPDQGEASEEHRATGRRIYRQTVMCLLLAVTDALGLYALQQPDMAEQGAAIAEGRIEQPAKESSFDLASARSVPAPPVSLVGRAEPPIVLARKQPILAKAQYDVVEALTRAGDDGLTQRELIRKSNHSDARNILKRLARVSPEWKAVISMAGKPGGGYRLRQPVA